MSLEVGQNCLLDSAFIMGVSKTRGLPRQISHCSRTKCHVFESHDNESNE